MHLLAISGSLRSQSANTALVHAMARLLSADATCAIYGGLPVLPAFNPDLDVEPALPAVEALRSQLREADAVWISSPEYAHGIPGALKNALDWVVSSGELVNKPVAIVNASPLSTFVTDQLRESITMMEGRVVVAEAVPLSTRPQDAAHLLTDAPAVAVLRAAVGKLLEAAGCKE